MCTTCGCSSGARSTITDLSGARLRPVAGHGHSHSHGEGHAHSPEYEHGHGHGQDSAHHHGDQHDHAYAHPHDQVHDHAHQHARAHGTLVQMEADILAHNNRLAERNRGWLAGRNVLALNLVSSPGAGKTTLLERSIRELAAEIPISVVEGDQETLFDAERIQATGAPSVQVNTGTGCHLEAAMLAGALEKLDPPAGSLLMIENVGNLVCPALFDLGEAAKVAILSVTEGADKPLKYPHMFRASQLMLLNKIDLLPHVAFDVAACIGFARRVNPGIHVLQVSATTGQGMSDWYDWLRQRLGRPAGGHARDDSQAATAPGEYAPAPQAREPV